MIDLKTKKFNILIGYTEIAGYFSGLFIGFKELGYCAAYINKDAYKYDYDDCSSQNFKILNIYHKIAKKKHWSKGLLKRGFYLIIHSFFTIIVFGWICIKFDVFVLGVGSSLFKMLDYKILKVLKKRIVYVSLGSDSRPQYINGNFKDEKGISVQTAEIKNKVRKMKRKIMKIEKYADILINYPQHAHFHSKTFISGMFVGFPVKDKSHYPEFTQTDQNNGPTRILHAPTRPLAKGSIQFREVIFELREEGLNIDYVEITNKPNLEVIEEIKKADIVLDELYSDLPLGGLGTEAGLFGKPVVVSGYYADFIRKDMDEVYIPPSIFVNPQNVKDALRTLIVNDELRITKGRELRDFIFSNWGSKSVAERYLDIITGSYPKSWEFQIKDIDYLFGWGLEKREVQTLIRRIVEEEGVEILQLSHNSTLQMRYQNLIGKSDIDG